MKRKVFLIFTALLCAVVCVLSACSPAGGQVGNGTTENSGAAGNNTENTGNSGTTGAGGDEEPPASGGTRIRFDFDGQTVYGTLDDNSVSRDLISRLPLTLTFSDYNGTEKIAYLPEGSDAWDTSDAPDSCTPAAGDITMYAPWGNIAIFYNSFRESDGLVPLGKLDEGGAEKLAAMTGDFTVTVSLAKVEQKKAKILIAYFSCTGNTKAAAERIAALTGGDLYEIVPAEPYSSADLNYNNSGCRANREMNDPTARPAIGSDKVDISAYDTVIVGYPIWWGTMPRIINTFLDAYDLTGKTVMPFCTSGGSGVSASVSDIKSAEPDATVTDGLRVAGTDNSVLESWLRQYGAIK